MRSICVLMQAVLAVALASTTVFAAPVTLQGLINFRDDRSTNPVGVSMGDLDLFGVNSAMPLGTTVTATRGTTSLPLFFFPFTILPNSYSRSIPWNGDATAWSLTAVNGTDSATASTPSIPTPRVIPLVLNLQVVGNGLTPTIQWTDPDLTGVTRSFVRVWDLNHTVSTLGVKDILFDSAPLSPTATSFTIPNGVLQLGGSYSFDVILDDQATSGGTTFVENRSETFSSPFAATPEPATLLLLGLGFGGLGTAIRGRRRRT